LSEAEIKRIQSRITSLGELGKQVDRKLCWLGDKKNVAEILEQAKKDFPLIPVADPEVKGFVWADFPTQEKLHEWFLKWFGEPQK